MPNRRQHTALSRFFLGDLSLGSEFQRRLDIHSTEMGPWHRSVDHTWERMNYISEMYGPVGYAEVLIHLMADYGLLPPALESISKKGECNGTT